jgi:phage baseplate assembly protein W
MAIPSLTNIYGKIVTPQVKSSISGKIEKLIGFKYPIVNTPSNGYFSKQSGVALLKSNLRQLIRTERGERFMLPNYGCGLKQYLMEPLDETTFNEVKTKIVESINTYLSNIEISKLQVFETRSGIMNVKLYCNLRDEENFRFDTEVNV